MAKIEFFQPNALDNIDSWSSESYVNSQGETRLTALSYLENNIIKAQAQGFDISESDAMAANSFEPILAGDDILVGSWGDDVLMGYSKQDQINGGDGDDFIHGMHGKDILRGGIGDDEIRGGHGPDELWGELGGDFLWGGVGRNTLYAGSEDLAHDDLYVPVDSLKNEEYGNPNGANRDLLYEVGLEDAIWIEGIADAGLTYQAGITDPHGSGSTGVGIYANGTLEALVVGDLSVADVAGMTTGGFFA